ncbi:hypothetical protein TNCV_4959791 [Trichonephila clavipes]|uniref:Uncharacterized protein n=1 Tax=Trichonephila clavipes TaxID=2585209 RepID=A0A8X6VI57_TRICX|nr:hypothetical protein TNCV_4959791 [Trichonephila clavipes]
MPPMSQKLQRIVIESLADYTRFSPNGGERTVIGTARTLGRQSRRVPVISRLTSSVRSRGVTVLLASSVSSAATESG